MEWLVENWYMLVGAVAVLVAAGIVIYKFINLPLSDKWKKISAWLLQAVIAAEKELGGKTGQLKLSLVYDAFIERFPFASSIISFTTFSRLVDEALTRMRKMIEDNSAIANIVSSEGNVE